MSVTVKTAATRLCPFIRDWNYDARARDDSPPVYEHIKCAGPGCMAWRWDDFAEVVPSEHRQGFCGLVARVLVPYERTDRSSGPGSAA